MISKKTNKLLFLVDRYNKDIRCNITGATQVRANFWVQDVAKINEADLGISVSLFFRLVRYYK